MKKCLASLLVLACVAPAMAAGTITFGAPNLSTPGQAVIPWTATEGVVGISLKVDCSAGTISSFTVDSFFDIFIDLAYDQGSGYDYGNGAGANNTNGAKQNEHGTLPLPQAHFSISVGGLGGPAKPLAPAPTSGSITLKTAGTVAVPVVMSADPLRGGVVAKSGAMGLAGTANLTFTISAPSASCRDKFDAATQAYYDRYVTEPVAWCWQFQCKGDADNGTESVFIEGDYRIYDADLTLLVNNWKGTPEGGANPAADFDHMEEAVFIEGSYAIYDGDLTILVNNWKKTDGELSNCPSYLP